MKDILFHHDAKQSSLSQTLHLRDYTRMNNPKHLGSSQEDNLTVRKGLPAC